MSLRYLEAHLIICEKAYHYNHHSLTGKQQHNMKSNILQILLFLMLIGGVSTNSMAQRLQSGYFTNGYLYRHQMNPAMGNDSINYISIPFFGNNHVSTLANIGYENIFQPNPQYPEHSNEEFTTFMNPFITNALSSFHKGTNRIELDASTSILSTGFKAFGGYNSFEINVRCRAEMSLPYEFFEFARNTGNKRYEFDNINMCGQMFNEIALGHSRAINNHWRIGSKLKLLLGIIDATLKMNKVVADLQNDKTWRVQNDVQTHISLKELQYTTHTKTYKKTEEKPDEVVNGVKTEQGGIGGWGLAVDLGVIYQLNPLWKFSASLVDLGFINWSNDIHATNIKKEFVFEGFQDVEVGKNQEDKLQKQAYNYSDQISKFTNLEFVGNEGSRTTTIGATLYLGTQYTLPIYRPLSFGLLSTTRLAGAYSWTEGRLSTNFAPCHWFSAGVNVAANSFTTSVGWCLNIHPKGLQLFTGMDHILGKLSKEHIPLSGNFSFNLGINVAW